MDYFVDQIPYLPGTWKPFVKKLATSCVLVLWGDWFIGLRSPVDVLGSNPSLLFYELVFYVLSILTIVHAYRNGARYVYLWIGIFIHGLVTELISYSIPQVDNFWHAQSTVMLFGRRAPLHVLLLYPIYNYTASIAAKRLKLPILAEACAVGLGSVLMDIPYDIMGVKLLWWSWHDTDPNIYDRSYHVPWTSYYFHASFACSFTLLLHFFRRWLLPKEYDWKLFGRELFCALAAGTLAFWLGALQFGLVYHPLHDMFGVHSKICVGIFLVTYVLIIWIADRKPKQIHKSEFSWFDELFVVLVLHYLFYVVLVIFADPSSNVSPGLHQPIGSCSESLPIYTATGLVLQKKRYLCPHRYDEPYFDFSCAQAGGKPPKLQDDAAGRSIEWYTICGNAFQNHAEYITVIAAACVFGLSWFYVCLSTSSTPRDVVKQYKQKVH